MVHTVCSVYGCKSTSKQNKNLKFHRFPRDARCKYWIEACRRHDLRDVGVEQLYNKHVCSLHFEEWMYMKTKLKSASIPIINLPSPSIHSMSTQTEAPRNEIIITELHSRGVKQEIDTTTVGVSTVASTSAQTSQTTTTNYSPKRNLQKQLTTCVKKIKMEDDMSKDVNVTYQQFLQGCDKFLSPHLSNIVKAQAHCATDKGTE